MYGEYRIAVYIVLQYLKFRYIREILNKQLIVISYATQGYNRNYCALLIDALRVATELHC